MKPSSAHSSKSAGPWSAKPSCSSKRTASSPPAEVWAGSSPRPRPDRASRISRPFELALADTDSPITVAASRSRAAAEHGIRLHPSRARDRSQCLVSRERAPSRRRADRHRPGASARRQISQRFPSGHRRRPAPGRRRCGHSARRPSKVAPMVLTSAHCQIVPGSSAPRAANSSGCSRNRPRAHPDPGRRGGLRSDLPGQVHHLLPRRSATVFQSPPA